ncbi:MAG: shikimate dehydrogenase [Bacteroidales bacterium]|nr:shikimate dehydrogenase [Bacteroidales bacterium]
MRIFGLIGYPLSHSFSPAFFDEKFRKEKINDADYQLFPLENLQDFRLLISNNPKLSGLNITIPYKKNIIPLLDDISEEATAIGSVNTIKILRNSDSVFLKGYNTDVIGFYKSILPLIFPMDKKALILGNGGSAASVKYCLENQCRIHCTVVSRHPGPGHIIWEEIDRTIIESHTIIINTTPLGMWPALSEKPPLPYHFIHSGHLLFDLIYNPAITGFMAEGSERGARVQNGQAMLEIQAEAAWEIWNS